MVDSNDFGWISAAFIGLSMFSFTRHLNAQSGFSNDDVKQRPGQVVKSIELEKNGRFLWQKFSVELMPLWFSRLVPSILAGRRSLLWRLGTHQSASKEKNKKTELLWGCCSQVFAMEMPWNSDAASSQQVAFQEIQFCFLEPWEWIPSSSRHYLTSRHVAP